jgi:hypothetical protein
MKNRNYYKSELDKVDAKSGHPANIKITSPGFGNDTKWLSLNDESANELVKWLKQNYNITEAE